MIAIFIAFLAIEAVFLLAACLYVSPLIGTRTTSAPPVVLPMAIVKPTAWRRRSRTGDK